MSFRPWAVAAVLIVAFLLDAGLLATERILSPDAGPEVKKYDEPMRSLQYLPGNRRGNFQAMGMEYDMAEAAANHISRFQKQGPRFTRMLEDQAAEVVDVFCPGELPQPYMALAYLVYSENDVRSVVDPQTLVRFERQPWYDTSGLVPALYDRFERTEARKAEAALMGVSAALVGREDDALSGSNPWALGLVGFWGFARLSRQEPRIRAVAIEYFGLMHFLTELANVRGGICS